MTSPLTIIWQGISDARTDKSLEYRSDNASYHDLMSILSKWFGAQQCRGGILTDYNRDIEIYNDRDLEEAIESSSTLYFFDEANRGKKDLVRCYDEIANLEPHHGVMTEASAYPQSSIVMRGTERVYSVTWPLSELIDNSISAIRTKMNIPSFQ